MEPDSPYRPRVSRETRLLLTAGAIAVAVLWLLARIRFPERPVSPNPVPSVLSQLADSPNYEDLAKEIAQLEARLQPLLFSLAVQSDDRDTVRSSRRTVLRVRDDLGVTWLPPTSQPGQGADVTILAHDVASGLAVVRAPTPLTIPPAVPWTPRQPQQPRYLVASDVSPAGVSLRPAFVGSLDSIDTPLWSEPLWAVPERTDLAAGSFLFTASAEWAGLAIGYGGGLMIVPGETILAEVERLLGTPPGLPGAIGVEVQDLTPPVASVTGASSGLVVAWVDPDGASSQRLIAGDVIEAVDGRPLDSRSFWDVRMARLSAGDILTLRVRRRGELHEVALTAHAPAPQRANRSLGLTLRVRTTIGAEVVRVEPASAADRAGLTAGDVITRIADLSAPTAAQVTRSFASLAQGEGVMVAVTRGDAHFVTTLER